ncbi:unnamed protein product [Closterium sp. NIES-64]|nr:unnamed protein product [Closterium sp. NIES-64]
MALTAADAGPIYNLLEAALNEATRKEAEQALNAYETRVGFCSCLLEIISRKELDQKGGARWLAAIYFKNSINRYWRARRETQGISDEEKPVLRARLLELVADENSQVAVQLAVLIAKIARIDYPREWSELFPTLLQKLQSQDPLLTQRAYLVLNHVLKELSTKRLSVDQRTFSQVTSQLFEPTWAHWVRDTGSLLQGLTALEAGGSDPAAAAAGAGAAGGALMLLCERWLLCVKTLRRMLVFGFPSDFKSVQEVPVLEQVVPAFLEAAQSLLNFRNLSQQRPALQPLHTFLSRASVKLLKTLVASHELHPFSFASKSVLLPTLDFCYTQITTTDPTASSPSPSLSTPLAAATSPQTPATAAAAAAAATDASASSSASSHGLFLIECMLFLQSVLRCVAYKQNPTGHVVGAAVASAEEMRGKLSGMARQQLQGFFSQEKVVTLGGVLVQRYLVLTAGDLEEWGADPEVFYHEQGAVQWKDKLQLCQSSLFHLSLFLALPDSLLCLFSQLLGADSSGFRGVGGGPRADLEEWGADPEVFYDEQGTVHYLVLTAGDLEESGADPEVFYHEQGAVQWKDKLRPSSYPLHLSLSSSVSLPCLADSYLVLTAGDLEEWGLDPEVFYHEQGAVQWKDKLRPCAEALLLLLFEQFKEVLSPALMNMLRQCIEACPPPASPDADVPVTPALLLKDACYDAVGVACYDLHDVVDFKTCEFCVVRWVVMGAVRLTADTDGPVTPALLLKDACYDAVGVACYDLHDLVDFRTWFTTALLPDMACRHPNARILRRRAAWMVGQWVGKVEGDLCVPAYQALISLLPDEDLVVQWVGKVEGDLCVPAYQALISLLPDEDLVVQAVASAGGRAAWMVGQWVGKVEGDLCASLPGAHLPAARRRSGGPAYQALISLLPDEDLVVQLTAVSSLRTLIDDVHFYEDQFALFPNASSFLPPSLDTSPTLPIHQLTAVSSLHTLIDDLTAVSSLRTLIDDLTAVSSLRTLIDDLTAVSSLRTLIDDLTAVSSLRTLIDDLTAVSSLRTLIDDLTAVSSLRTLIDDLTAVSSLRTLIDDLTAVSSLRTLIDDLTAVSSLRTLIDDLTAVSSLRTLIDDLTAVSSLRTLIDDLTAVSSLRTLIDDLTAVSSLRTLIDDLTAVSSLRTLIDDLTAVSSLRTLIDDLTAVSSLRTLIDDLTAVSSLRTLIDDLTAVSSLRTLIDDLTAVSSLRTLIDDLTAVSSLRTLIDDLTAVSSLRTLIDDVHFYEDQFAPFLDTAVQLLFRCLQQVSEFDSQLQIVNVVSLIIERMGEKIVPLADKILSCLPQVWEQSEGQPLLRIQVMQALQRLIVSLGPQSPISYPLLFPILRYSTDISQPDELNMLEDGLQLWQATLRHAPAMVPEFMTLFANLVPIMDRSFEHLPVATAIMESYVLVGGPAFLQQHAGSLVSMIDAVVGNVKEKAMLLVAGLVDLIIQCYPSEAPPALESVLQKLLLIIIGPTEYSDLVRGTCATVLARVVLQNSSYFAQFISADSTRHLLQQQSAAKGNAPPLALFLDAWLDKVDSVSVPAKRKLSTLALAVLLTMPEPQILERLDLILSVCTGSLGEDNPDNTPLLPDISTVGYDYASVSDSIQGGEGAPVECEALRRRQVASIDPVHRVAVGPFLKEKLQACVAVHGEQQFQAAMARVPPPIVSQLQQL